MQSKRLKKSLEIHMLKKIFIRSSIGSLVATSLLFGYYFYFKYFDLTENA